jgi:GNAT superfamily N-acetyltransferase
VEKIDPVTIRPVPAGEIQRLSSLARKAYLDRYHWLWTDDGDWYAELSFSLSSLKRELMDPSNQYFFASWEGEPVGFLKWRDESPEADFPVRSLYLERIYLVSGAVGRGIGSVIMDFATAYASERGLSFIELKAMECSPKSIAFYKKCGFQIFGTDWLDYPLLKDQYRGMVKMKKDLHPSFT